MRKRMSGVCNQPQQRRFEPNGLQPVSYTHLDVYKRQITGAAADDRATCKPSQMGAIAVALYNAVTNGAPPSLSSKKLNQLVTKAAADLKKGNGLVVCGVNDVNIQTVVNAINAAIGANGTTCLLYTSRCV